MRLDLFLKNTRLVKRRSSAKAAVLGGAVLVNGHPGKPGKEVRAGDLLSILEEEEAPVRIRVLREALRPVPKGEEGDFFAVEGGES